MASITLTDENEKIVKQYADEKGIPLSDAGNRLIQSGNFRLVAIRKYAEAQRAAKPAKAKKAAKAPKAAKAAKGVKAKGPLARKQASKAKAPTIRKRKTAIPATLDAAEGAPLQ